MYKLFEINDEVVGACKTDNSFKVCFNFTDPANTDAVEFAKWMQEGNRPEPAEEGGTVTDEWVAETIARLLPADQPE